MYISQLIFVIVFIEAIINRFPPHDFWTCYLSVLVEDEQTNIRAYKHHKIKLEGGGLTDGHTNIHTYIQTL